MRNPKTNQKSFNFFNFRADFMDYSVPLSELKHESNQNDGNDEDKSIDPNAEEFQENQYLSGNNCVK